MIEVVGNLWDFPADVRVITTNGTVKKNGECVMGRGCALEAKRFQPEIPKLLGHHIQETKSNTPFLFPAILKGARLVSFPVKHNWYEKADIDLIEVSARILTAWANMPDKVGVWNTVVLPRPGCGNGGLRWEDVKPVLEPILDDRFHVITFG